MGKLDPVKLNPALDHHVSHGLGDHVTGHAVPGNIARDGSPKRAYPVKIHGGQVKHIADGSYRAFGGDHASAIDAVSGVTVPAGRNVSTPGYGNAGLQSGHPFAKAPGSKNLTRVETSFGMRSRNPGVAELGSKLHELGAAILDQAFSVASPDDCMAHGRGADGKKIK